MTEPACPVHGPIDGEDLEVGGCPACLYGCAPTVGLAAFFSQPADEDEPETTLAAFYAQPSADDEEEEDEPTIEPFSSVLRKHRDGRGKGVTDTAVVLSYTPTAPDSDDYLGEFRVDELVAHLGKRYGGTVVAVVVHVEDEEHPRLVVTP